MVVGGTAGVMSDEDESGKDDNMVFVFKDGKCMVMSKEEEAVLVKAIQENPLIYSLLVKDKEGEGLQMLPLSRLCSESSDSALICVMDPSSSPQQDI